MIAAAGGQTDLADLPASDIVDQFLERVVEDLPYGDITGGLKRLSHAGDRLNLAISKDAARLAALWRTSPLFCKSR